MLASPCQRAAREEGGEVAGGAHELAPFQQPALRLAGGGERDVGVDGVHGRDDEGGEADGVRAAGPERTDDRGRRDQGEVHPDELQAAQQPPRLMGGHAGQGRHPCADREREHGVEQDAGEHRPRAPHAAARLVAPVGVPAGGTRRGRDEEEPRDGEEGAVAEGPQEVYEPEGPCGGRAEGEGGGGVAGGCRGLRGGGIAQLDPGRGPREERLEGVEHRDGEDGREAERLYARVPRPACRLRRHVRPDPPTRSGRRAPRAPRPSSRARTRG